MLHSHLFHWGRLSFYSYSISETILSLFKTEQMCYFIFLSLASHLPILMHEKKFIPIHSRGAQSKVRAYTMLVPTGENVTLFSDFSLEIFDSFLCMVFKKLPFSLRLKKLTLFYDAVNKAWNMPAPQNE